MISPRYTEGQATEEEGVKCRPCTGTPLRALQNFGFPLARSPLPFSKSRQPWSRWFGAWSRFFARTDSFQHSIDSHSILYIHPSNHASVYSNACIVHLDLTFSSTQHWKFEHRQSMLSTRSPLLELEWRAPPAWTSVVSPPVDTHLQSDEHSSRPNNPALLCPVALPARSTF